MEKLYLVVQWDMPPEMTKSLCRIRSLDCSPRLVAVLEPEVRARRDRPDVAEVDDDVGDRGRRHRRRLQQEVDLQEHRDRRQAEQGAHQGRVQLQGKNKIPYFPGEH